MYPGRTGVLKHLTHTQATIHRTKSQNRDLVHEQCLVAQVEHHLIRIHRRTGHVGQGVTELGSVEKRHLVQILPADVVLKHGCRQLRHSGVLSDHQTTQCDVAHQYAIGIHIQTDTLQRTTGKLVRCNHTSTVQALLLGNEHWIHPVVCLYKQVELTLTCRFVLEAQCQLAIV